MSTLGRLEAVSQSRREATVAWERLIRRASAEGHSLRQIAAAAGVTHMAIAKKLAK